jgi:predicted glycosyltransferase
LEYTKVGRHHGKSRLRKAMGLSYRALQLSALVMRQKPALGVSHGSRSQLLLSNWLRIPTLLLEDYEHARFPFSMRPTWVMAPTSIADEDLSARKDRIRKYQGIKEDVYAWKLKPDERILESLGLTAKDLIVTVRPPATEAHYHNPESEVLFETFMKKACSSPLVKVVLLPRNKKQAELIRARWPKWFEDKKKTTQNDMSKEQSKTAVLEMQEQISDYDLIISAATDALSRINKKTDTQKD